MQRSILEGVSAARMGYDRRTIEDQKEKGEPVTHLTRNGLYGDNGRRQNFELL
jgi:hypothetical protein